MKKNKEHSVSLRCCDTYEAEKVKDVVKTLFSDISLSQSEVQGKNIVIKPNLVRKMDISAAGTTNPALVEASAKIFFDMGASSVVIAESPAGAYTESSIAASYKVGKMTSAAEMSGARLNFDLGAKRIVSSAKENRAFNIINPIADADIVVNICKLKTHNLTGMSGAVKNFFGVVPGTEKLEMHALYPNLKDFSSMICDLCKTVCDRASVINIMDAVVAMEGNGPTNGKPKKLGFVGVSHDPFALDAVASMIICMDDSVTTVEESKRRGYIPEKSEDIELLGDDIPICRDFVLPDSADRNRSGITVLSKLFGGKLMETLRPRPLVNKHKCVGCGECMRSCPASTIVMRDKIAFIKKSACIKCFCCQELCPKDAILVKKNPILKIVR